MHSARPHRRSSVRTICANHRQTDPSRHRRADVLDELPLARALVRGWRFQPVEVTYEHRTLLFGGPVSFALSGLASMCGNRRARKVAERASAPQWRDLGPIDVVATADRLLVWHERSWWSVWYSAIISTTHSDDRLEMHFVDDDPYLLVGDVAAVGAVVECAVSTREHASVLRRSVGAR